MTQKEAWEAYRLQKRVRIGERWRRGGGEGVIATPKTVYVGKDETFCHTWFGIRVEGDILKYYGAEQLREAL